jgi:hypothetical protein
VATIANTVCCARLTEMKKDNHEEYHDDITRYADVRATDLDKDFGPFWTFFDKFTSCIRG